MKNKTNVAAAVGERIRQFRTRQHLSQEELAFASEIHPAYIGKVERGEKCPTIETVSKIANGLKVSIPKLLDIDSNTEVEEEDAFHRIKVAMNGLSPEQMVKIAQIVEEITDFTQEPFLIHLQANEKQGSVFVLLFLFFRQNFYSSILFEKLKWHNISIK